MISDTGFLPSLTYDALLGVLSLLNVQDLGRLAQVSKEAKEVAQDDVVWKRLCRDLEGEWGKLFTLQASAVPPSSPPSSPSSNTTATTTTPATTTTTSSVSYTLSSPPAKTPLSVSIQPSQSRDWKETYHFERTRVLYSMKFVGIWNEKWCDVDVDHSTLITSDGTTFFVSYTKNKFTATFREYRESTNTLVFHLVGGDSGWSFLYHLTPRADGSMSLHVLRLHDNTGFDGMFQRDV